MFAKGGAVHRMQEGGMAPPPAAMASQQGGMPPEQQAAMEQMLGQAAGQFAAIDEAQDYEQMINASAAINSPCPRAVMSLPTW